MMTCFFFLWLDLLLELSESLWTEGDGDRVLRAVILDVFDQQLQQAGLFPGGERIPYRLEFSQRLADLILRPAASP